MTALVVLRAKTRQERMRERLKDAASGLNDAARTAADRGKRLSKNPQVMTLAGIAAGAAAVGAAPVLVGTAVIGWHAMKVGAIMGENIAKRGR